MKKDIIIIFESINFQEPILNAILGTELLQALLSFNFPIHKMGTIISETEGSCDIKKKINSPGTWVAKWIKHKAPDFDSHHDLRVLRWNLPQDSVLSGESARDTLLSFCLSPDSCVYVLINKSLKKYISLHFSNLLII